MPYAGLSLEGMTALVTGSGTRYREGAGGRTGAGRGPTWRYLMLTNNYQAQQRRRRR